MSGASVTTLARMMFGRRLRMIAVLGAFFDDSGTHAGSPLVVIGGLLGTEEQWNAFAAAWGALLARPLPGKPSLREFHLSACRAGQDEFQTYNRAERDRITYLFRRIILDIGFVTIAAAVNRTAWDELLTADVMEKMGGPVDPIEYCFVKCLDTTVEVIRSRKPGEKVILFFDEATRPRLEGWARFSRMQTAKYPELETIIFAPVPDVVALQGGDMIAAETYQYGRVWLRDGENAVANAHFREYLKRDLSFGFIVDRDHIAEMVSRVREQAPSSGPLS